MMKLVTNKQFAKAVCDELGICTSREDAPLCSVITETSSFGDLAKITVSFYVGYGLTEKIGQRMAANAAAEKIITTMFPDDGGQS